MVEVCTLGVLVDDVTKIVCFIRSGQGHRITDGLLHFELPLTEYFKSVSLLDFYFKI